MIFLMFFFPIVLCHPSCAPSCIECVNDTVCLGCEAGYWGKHCLHVCPRTCGDDGACERESGACASCVVGKYGTECQWPCPRGCAAVPEPTAVGRGPCVAIGSGNGTVVDEEVQPAPRCLYSCTIGLWSSSRECAEPCPGNCAASPTNKTLAGGPCASQFNCTHGCVQGTFGLGCSRGCPHCVPALDDGTDTCDFDGRCTAGCVRGRFGPTCESNCSLACSDVGCDSTSGDCFGCAANQILCGPRCEHIIYCKNSSVCPTGTPPDCGECQDMHFGPLCHFACPMNCQRCDKRTGECLLCLGSYFGQKCDQVNYNCAEATAVDGTCRRCTSKAWGVSCEKSCSECDEAEVLEDREKGACNKTTGECLWGSSERSREAAALWVPISLFMFLPITVFSIIGIVSGIVACRAKRAAAREAKEKELAAIDGTGQPSPPPAAAAGEEAAAT